MRDLPVAAGEVHGAGEADVAALPGPGGAASPGRAARPRAVSERDGYQRLCMRKLLPASILLLLLVFLPFALSG